MGKEAPKGKGNKWTHILVAYWAGWLVALVFSVFICPSHTTHSVLETEFDGDVYVYPTKAIFPPEEPISVEIHILNTTREEIDFVAIDADVFTERENLENYLPDNRTLLQVYTQVISLDEFQDMEYEGRVFGVETVFSFVPDFDNIEWSERLPANTIFTWRFEVIVAGVERGYAYGETSAAGWRGQVSLGEEMK